MNRPSGNKTPIIIDKAQSAVDEFCAENNIDPTDIEAMLNEHMRIPYVIDMSCVEFKNMTMHMAKQITKKELFAALEDYSDNARIFFNADDNLSVIHVDKIDYIDDDRMPVLSSDPGGPMIFIHLKKG